MKKVQLAAIALLLTLTMNKVLGQINPISNGEKGTAQLVERKPLKRGEIVSLEVVGNINSENLQIGDVVKLSVAKPVVVDGYTMITRGAYAEAIVRDVKRARGYGRGGLIILEAVNVETFDKQRIPLKSNGLLVVKGRDRIGLAWSVTAMSVVVASGVGVATFGATGVFVGVPLITLGSMIRGREAVIESGKMMSATIMETKNVETDPKLTTH